MTICGKNLTINIYVYCGRGKPPRTVLGAALHRLENRQNEKVLPACLLQKSRCTVSVFSGAHARSIFWRYT